MKAKKLIVEILLVLFIIAIPKITFAEGINGTTIVLNPGHGGRDTGCINREKRLYEKDLTLKISRYLEEELSKYYNVKVISTHNGVVFPKDDYGDLYARAMIARNNKADLYVSLHINDFSNHEKNGASVYVTSRTELYKYKEGMTILGNLILDKLCALGINREGLYNNNLISNRTDKYKYYDGSDGDYYADIRAAMKGDTEDLGPDFRDGSGISTVLIEHCYINNSNDVQFLDSDEDLRKLAKADCEAIVEYYKLKLKSDVAADISVDTSTRNLLKGENNKTTATVLPSTAINKELKWTSQDESIATVDAFGNIKAINIGKTNIVVTSLDNPNVTKTIPVNVEEYKVEFKEDSYYMLKGRNEALDVTISPSWIENKNVVWTSSNTEILDISQTGIVTGKQVGTATVTVTWQEQNFSDEIIVNVIELPDNTSLLFGDYITTEDKISNIGENVEMTQFLNNISISDNLEIEIKPLFPNQKYIGTNTKIIIKEKEHNLKICEYDCLIYADINGDGKISAMDYALIKNHIMDVKKITDANIKLVADINEDGKISAMDYALIKNHIMDVKKITKK